MVGRFGKGVREKAGEGARCPLAWVYLVYISTLNVENNFHNFGIVIYPVHIPYILQLRPYAKSHDPLISLRPL